VQKTSIVSTPGRGFAACFPLDILMVHSSALTVATDSERLMCGGLSLGETVHFGNLEFIAECFGSLCLSRKGSDLGAFFMVTTRSWSPSLQTMIEDSTDEFYMASSGEGSSSLLPSQPHCGWRTPRRHSDHDGGSTMDAHTVDGHRATSRATIRFLGGVTSLSPCSARQHRAQGRSMVKEAHR
jgi:hypothetical protein